MSILNAPAYKIQFVRQGDEVVYDDEQLYPIHILGFNFNYKNKLDKPDFKEIKKNIKENYFRSLIWCSYRSNIYPPLISDERSTKYILSFWDNRTHKTQIKNI